MVELLTVFFFESYKTSEYCEAGQEERALGRGGGLVRGDFGVEWT